MARFNDIIFDVQIICIKFSFDLQSRKSCDPGKAILVKVSFYLLNFP